MTRAEEYRAHARYCATAAKFMSSDRAKREFEKQARGWRKMAERAESDEQGTRSFRLSHRSVSLPRKGNKPSH
jgi:hypothetical protein